MIHKPKDVLQALKKYKKQNDELVICFFLDDTHSVLAIQEYTALKFIQLNLADIFVPALHAYAKAVVIAQVKTQLKGEYVPTKKEKMLTGAIVKAGCFLGITCVDHIIMTQSQYYSFHESNVLTYCA
mgnify:FL=1